MKYEKALYYRNGGFYAADRHYPFDKLCKSL